ncbi:MAG TPA: hypothetical protein VF445_04135 [Bordetella sp.]|uniref:hypothetical protein n=1 Tax=Bordetella sp. TaxID=28081 RepID=UPI002ED29BF1
MSVSVPPLISRYAARHGVADAVRADGRAILVIDDKYRVRFAPARNGWVALSARLCALPPAGAARENFLAGLGRQAVGMLDKYASGCTIDPDEEALWLEQMLRPDAVDTEVDEAVGQFANALSFWTSAVRRAA